MFFKRTAMEEWPSTVSFLFILGILCMWVFYRTRAASSTKPYPPGPLGHPLLGNLWDMPSENAMIRFRDWCQTYGPVIHLWVPGQSIIILDKYQAAVDLLDKRSLIYSDRPTLRMLRDVIGWDWSVVMLNYGERFRKHRRAFYQGLHIHVKHYNALQEDESRRLLLRLLESPTDFMVHSERWGRSLLSRVSYGYDPEPNNDRYVWLAKELEHVIADVARPGAYLVDTFPLLKHVPSWFPGATFKRRAKVWSTMVTELLETPFDYVMHQMQKGSAPPSYVALMLKDKLDTLSTEEKNIIKETAAVVHIAGANSIYAAVQSLLLVLVLYPEVQRKAQEEIDTVVGSERLPGLTDRDRLPYVHNMVSEMLRWTRSVPLGVAHELKQDDYYNGMFIPARSLVMANIWSMTRDESLYDHPEEFNPERFEKSGVQDPRDIVFGFGRRVCPGMRFADSALFVVFAHILAAFNISNALEKTGKPIVPIVEYTSGFTTFPKPFLCSVSPRSRTVENLIRAQAR